MKTIFMVLYNFPPVSDAGVHRSLRFIKYLSTFGWKIVVLTIKENQYPKHICIDNGLCKKIPDSVIVHRTNNMFYEHTPFTIPDSKVGWIFPAIRAGKQVIKRVKPDVIYSSAPPWTCHLIACYLKGYSNVPLIVDFRDPWAQAPFKQKIWKKWEKRFHEVLERYVVNVSDVVVVNNNWVRDELLNYHSNIVKDKLVVINNGFDLADIENLDMNIPTNGSDKFIITHTGDLYGGRDPSPFLKAVENLINNAKIEPEKIKILFVGVKGNAFDIYNKIRRFNNNIVEVIPPVPYKESLAFLASSSVLLIFQGGTHLSIPSKLFEYMAIGKPILALTGEGATKDVIIQEQIGHVVDPYDPSEIEKGIMKLYQEWQLGMWNEDSERIGRIPDKYDARNLTLQFHNVLNKCIEAQRN
jgi:glycosyltransferase involved in cell wall biosynthesis